MGEFSFFHWLVLFGIGYFLYRLLKRPSINTHKTMPSASPMFAWPKLGNYECDIVGEGFCQPALQKLAGHHGKTSAEVYATALLVPYDTNPHDDKAVRVDIGGNPVGNLSRKDARAFRNRLAINNLGASTTRCGALVMGGFITQQGEVASYGVRLDIAPLG